MATLEETLKKFIFGENSWLYIGNDNSNPPNKFYDDPNQKYPYTIEIWDKDKYENAIENATDDFADLAEEVMGNLNDDEDGIS